MTVTRAEQDSDARLGLAVAAACLTGLVVFLLPLAAGRDGLPTVWGAAGALVVLVGPVAAGLAGWASLRALWRPDLPLAARRLHLVTLLLAAAYAVSLAYVWERGTLG